MYDFKFVDVFLFLFLKNIFTFDGNISIYYKLKI